MSIETGLSEPIKDLLLSRIYPNGYPNTIFDNHQELPQEQNTALLNEVRKKFRIPGKQYAEEVYAAVDERISEKEKIGAQVPKIVIEMVINGLQSSLPAADVSRLGRFLQRSVVGSEFSDEFYPNILAYEDDVEELVAKYFGAGRAGKDGEVRRTGNSYVPLNQYLDAAQIPDPDMVLHVRSTKGPSSIMHAKSRMEAMSPILDANITTVAFGKELTSAQVHESLRTSPPLEMGYRDLIEVMGLIIPIIESADGLNNPLALTKWTQNIIKSYRLIEPHTTESVEALSILTSIIDGNQIHHDMEF